MDGTTQLRMSAGLIKALYRPTRMHALMNGVLLKRKIKRKGEETERARASRSALVKKTLLLTFVHHQDKGTLQEQDNEADGKVLSVFRNFLRNYRKDDESSLSRIKIRSEPSIASGDSNKSLDFSYLLFPISLHKK